MRRTLVAFSILGFGFLISTGQIVSGPHTTGPTAVAPHKHALLVGVSGYCRQADGQCELGGKYWWDLHTAPDVDALRTVLKSETFGFRDSEIKVLKTPTETTHANIVRAFQEFLIDQTSPGDVVYFHYSGHGTEVRDDDESPFNPIRGESFDGMDASLVPSDYKSQTDGSNNIRGDEITILLQELARRHPSSVTLTIDSCYAGTVTRGGKRLVRGAKYTGQMPKPNVGGPIKSPSGFVGQGVLDSLGYVLISATRNNQLAQETADGTMGAFTSSFVRALKDANQNTTYRDIFERVSNEISTALYDQNPQIEGPKDRVLMSGVSLPPQAYFSVSVQGGTLSLDYGQLQGITPRSQFDIYLAGTRDFRKAKPLAQTTVSAVAPTASILALPPGSTVNLSDLKNGRAVETTHVFGDVRLKVAVAESAKRALPQGGIQRIKSTGLADLDTPLDGPWDEMICGDRCENEKGAQPLNAPAGTFYTVERNDGSIVSRPPTAGDPVAEIIQALEGEARWRFYKGLENRDPTLELSMRLVPVKNVKTFNNLAISADVVSEQVVPDSGGQILLHDQDTVMLEFKNTGSADVYVTTLDLRNDGSIAPLWPSPGIPLGNAEDNRIAHDGAWHRVPFPFVIQIQAPFGPEVFKAIGTTYPSDFSPLLSKTSADSLQRGNSRGGRALKSPLGPALAFGTLGNTHSRGAGVLGIDPKDLQLPVAAWVTAAVPFTAVPNETKEDTPQHP